MMFKRDKAKGYAFVGKPKAESRALSHVRMPDGGIVTVVNGRTYAKAKTIANKRIGEIVRKHQAETA